MCTAVICKQTDARALSYSLTSENKRHFLKRVKYEGITQQQLYVGSTVVVYARQMRLVDYGDQATKNTIEARSERLAQLTAAACQ